MSSFFLYLPVLDVEQIILRARQNHLFENFRAQTTSLTPDLLARVQGAWQLHVLNKVSKGLPESIKPTTESLLILWPQIEALLDDSVQKAECLKRDEKFEMNLGTAVRSSPLYAIVISLRIVDPYSICTIGRSPRPRRQGICLDSIRPVPGYNSGISG